VAYKNVRLGVRRDLNSSEGHIPRLRNKSALEHGCGETRLEEWRLVCAIAYSCPDRSAMVKPVRAKVHSELQLTQFRNSIVMPIFGSAALFYDSSSGRLSQTACLNTILCGKSFFISFVRVLVADLMLFHTLLKSLAKDFCRFFVCFPSGNILVCHSKEILVSFIYY
jgi:hypothetical protein